MSDIASPSPPTTWKTRVFDAVEDVGYRFEKVGDRLNSWAASNKVGRWFRFKDRQSSLTVELRAGFITFLMVSYVLAVQPNILSATGGPCNPEEVCDPDLYKEMGRACLGNPYDSGALKCLEELKTNLITATAASSLISTFLIGVLGNLPLALAPGIGITAYVAYDVVGPYGTGDLTYSQAMTAIFIEGWIFIILSVTGVRGGLVKYMPKNVAMATSVGIGLLLAFTGLGNLGVIAFDPNTLVGIGGCDARDRSFIYTFPAPINASQLAEGNLSSITQGGLLPIPAAVYGCNGKLMRSATMWLGISGGVLMSLLLFAGVKGAMVIGIVFVTVISWIPDHAASYLGASSAVAGGATRLELFKQVVAAPSLSLTGLSWDWSAFTKSHLWIALFTFLYIDLLDCTGTLLSMARLLDQFMPGFMSESYEFPGQMWAFLSDGIGILVGSMMGSTPLTVYIESAAGIEDGGRTGLTAVVVAFFFFVSLFFSPILASIPPFATGPALVLVGTILLGHIAHIEWDDIGQAIPAFLTIILMPFTYSVAYGVIAGLASYIIIHFPFWLWDTIMTKWNRGGGPYPRWTQKSRRLRNGMHHRRVYLSDGGGSRASFASLDPERSYHGGGGGLAMGVLPGSGLSLHPQNELTHPRHGGGEGGVGGYPGGLPPFPRPSPLFPAPGPRSPPGGGGGRLSRPGSKLSDLSDVDWDGGRPANRMLRRSITMDGGGNTPGGSVHGRPPLPGSFPGVGGGGRGEGLPLWERGEDDTFRRSFTYSGAGGLAGLATLFREGAVGDPRESSSYHGGDLYTNSSSRRESHDRVPFHRRIDPGPALLFSGGGFKLSEPAPAVAAVREGGEAMPPPPGFARTSYHSMGSEGGGGSQGRAAASFRLFSEDAEGGGHHETSLDAGGSFRLFGDVGEIEIPGSSENLGESEGDGMRRKSFQLFGDVPSFQILGSSEIPCSPEASARRKSFQLFGDVPSMRIPESTEIPGEPPLARKSLKLFGDVPSMRIPESTDIPGEPALKLFGDAGVRALAAGQLGRGGEGGRDPGEDSLESGRSFRLFGNVTSVVLPETSEREAEEGGNLSDSKGSRPQDSLDQPPPPHLHSSPSTSHPGSPTPDAPESALAADVAEGHPIPALRESSGNDPLHAGSSSRSSLPPNSSGVVLSDPSESDHLDLCTESLPQQQLVETGEGEGAGSSGGGGGGSSSGERSRNSGGVGGRGTAGVVASTSPPPGDLEGAGSRGGYEAPPPSAAWSGGGMRGPFHDLPPPPHTATLDRTSPFTSPHPHADPPAHTHTTTITTLDSSSGDGGGGGGGSGAPAPLAPPLPATSSSPMLPSSLGGGSLPGTASLVQQQEQRREEGEGSHRSSMGMQQHSQGQGGSFPGMLSGLPSSWEDDHEV